MTEEPKLVKWRAAPFVRLLIPFIIGILYGHHWELFDKVWGFCALVCGFSMLFTLNFRDKFSFIYSIFIGSITYIVMFCLGVLSIYLDNPFIDKAYYGHFINKGENEILLRVDDYAVTEKWVKAFGEVRQIRDGQGHSINTKGKILVYLKPGKSLPAYGQVLKVITKISLVPEIKNPYSFDYKQYLKNKNIYYQGFCREDKWIATYTFEKTLTTLANESRLSLIRLLKEHLGDGEEYAVGSALLFGYRSEISPELNNAYIQTGAIHILAVSGLHVGIISGLLSILLGIIKCRSLLIRLVKLFLILIFLWSFVFIAGASGSIIRAAVMFSILHSGTLLLHRKYIYNTLAASAFVILLFDPKMLFDVGFQLSYLAVIGIISIKPLLAKIWVPNNRAVFYVWEMVLITISAQIATLPLVLYYFHQTSLYFLISGIIVVPISTLAMYSGIALYFSNLCLPFLTIYIGKIMYACLFLMNKTIYLIQKIPGNLIDNIALSGVEAVLLSLFIFYFIFSVVIQRKAYLYFSLVFLVCFVLFRFYLEVKSMNQKQLTIYSSKQSVYIDFFQGQNCYQFYDCILPDEDKYVSNGNRIQHRIKSCTLIDYIGVAKSINVQLSDYKLRVYNEEFFFLENKSLPLYGIDTSRNVYVLNDLNPGLFKPNKCVSTILLNPTMSYKLREEWKNWAAFNGIKLIDLKNGAVSFNIH